MTLMYLGNDSVASAEKSKHGQTQSQSMAREKIKKIPPPSDADFRVNLGQLSHLYPVISSLL